MPQHKNRVLVFFSFLFLVFFISAAPALAIQSIDTSSGLDQTFTAGYSQKSFADSFHRDFDAPLDLEKGWDSWRVYKGLNFSTVYDSNVYEARTDEKDDFIYTVTPTVGIGRKGDLGYFETFYDLSYSDYMDEEKLSRFNHSITTNVGRDFDKLKMKVTNNFRPDSAYAVGERTEFRTPEAAKVITYSDTANLALTYALSPKTEIAYNQGVSVFYFPSGPNATNVEQQSSATYTFNPNVSYRLTPKITLNGGYSFETADFYKQGGRFDSDSQVVSVGLAGRLAPKTNTNLRAAYRTRDYDSSAFNGDDAFEFRAAVSQKLTQKLLATLWATRDLGENFDITQASTTNEIKDFYGINLTCVVTPHINVEGQASAGFTNRRGNYPTISDPDVASRRVSGPLENEFYESSVALNWSPKNYLAVSLGYKYLNKNSTFKNFEYDDHKVIGSLRLSF